MNKQNMTEIPQSQRITDCVKFKDDLHDSLWKKSGAKTLKEYAEYVNKRASEREQNNRK